MRRDGLPEEVIQKVFAEVALTMTKMHPGVDFKAFMDTPFPCETGSEDGQIEVLRAMKNTFGPMLSAFRRVHDDQLKRESQSN